jgi:adenosylmethionine-8-amino-7-oxononanoate aminotransferase
MGGTIDGQKGDHVMFAPPYIIAPKQVDEIIDKFTKAMKKTFGK